MSTIPTINRTPVPSPIQYAVAKGVFAALSSGASISVEEFPRGDAADAAQRAADRMREDGDSAVVLSLTRDVVGGAAIDTVWFHPDEDAKLEVIDRARAALDAAEAALESVGYVDNAHIVTA